MSAIIVTLFLGGPRGLFDIPIIPPVPESAAVADRQDHLLPVRLHLDPGHAAPPPLRPADGSRLEDPHPARLRVVPVHHRAAAGRRRGLEPVSSSRASRSSSCWPASACSLCGLPGRVPGDAPSRGRCSDGSTSRASSSRCARSTGAGHHARTRAASRSDAKDVKTPKPERLHGRHVLNRYEDGMEKCIGCELCAGVCPARCIYVRGADNSVDRPGLTRRALRLRLRDQLPAVHPLRPVRGGLPHRGHHRDQAVRVLLHQPPATPSTPRPSCWSTTTASPGSCPGRTGGTATTSTRRAGCGPPRRRATRPSRAGGVVGRARLRRPCRRRRASRPRPTRTSRRPLAAAAARHLTPGEAAREQAHDEPRTQRATGIDRHHRVRAGRRHGAGRRHRRGDPHQPGALRAQPRADAVRHGRAVRSLRRRTSWPPSRSSSTPAPSWCCSSS